jgi:hypothetical protein
MAERQAGRRVVVAAVVAMLLPQRLFLILDRMVLQLEPLLAQHLLSA